jgi:two-component system response regulator (stage 0 sporulation protein F)
MNYTLDEGTPDDGQSDDAESRPRTRRARILVVDDDGDMRGLLVARLASEGYDVREAVSGTELLRVLQSISVDLWPLDGVDLIVLDNRMPGMTGLEAIRKLRAAQCNVPAILVTAFPEPALCSDAAALGVPVLSKPCSFGLLTTAVLLSLLSEPDRPLKYGFSVPS